MQLLPCLACILLALSDRGRVAFSLLGHRCESTVGAPHPGKLLMNIEIKPSYDAIVSTHCQHAAEVCRHAEGDERGKELLGAETAERSSSVDGIILYFIPQLSYTS